MNVVCVNFVAVFVVAEMRRVAPHAIRMNEWRAGAQNKNAMQLQDMYRFSYTDVLQHGAL